MDLAYVMDLRTWTNPTLLAPFVVAMAVIVELELSGHFPRRCGSPFSPNVTVLGLSPQLFKDFKSFLHPL